MSRAAGILALAASLLLAGVAEGRAQAGELAGEFSGQTLESLRREVARADSAGVPTRPLVLKALEGRRKGASDPQVLRAVAALRARLTTAMAIAGRDASEDVLVAAAGALYVGIDAGTLDAMIARTREDALGMALIVVGDLVRRGVPVDQAGRAVLSLGEAGADAADFSEFRRRVDEDISTGLAPGRATEVRTRGVLTGLGQPRALP